MLSAVELHSGPGAVGIYSHHPPFGRPSVAHLQPMPLVSSTIIQQKQQNSPMSETEFARPKPKNLNGLTSPSSIPLSPTQKYSHHEQNGPVNLSHQSSSRGPSPACNDQNDQKEIDVVGLGSTASSMIGSPMSYATASSRLASYPPGLGTNAYQALNYNFYGNRYGAPIFPPHRSPYPQHSSRPTYLPSQLDSYPSYLSASVASYSTNPGYSAAISSPQLPSNPEVSPASFKTSSDRSHSLPSSNNGHHPYLTKEKDVKASSRASHDRNNFKVPSGKEGSLKHRILTTTTSRDKHGTINHPANRPSHNNTSLLNFTRGSLIELSNGSLRRVEDLRTEDFMSSAEKSPDLQLADSTVVKILSSGNNCVMITFSYDNNRSKVDIEAKLEHPFFVYGQGWASCDPDGSFSAFGLKCQRLQVGDVCISLKLREPKIESPQLSPLPPKRNLYQQHMQQRDLYYHQQMKEQQQLPQNLSRRASTNSGPTTDASLAQMAKYSPTFYNLQMSLFAAASQGRFPASYADYMNDDASHPQQHDLNTSNMNNNNSCDKLSKSNLCPTSLEDEKSRKRRWSAPDTEDEQAQGKN